jgi:hypothetical protein
MTAEHTDRTPAQLADQAAEAVRALNHATISGGYEWPSDVDDVVAGLGRAAARMAQAIDQASRWITAQHDAGRVGLDQRGDSAPRIQHLREYLELASCDAGMLGRSLDLARSETTHLTGLRP